MSEQPQITWYHAEIKTGPVPHQITTTSGPAFAAFLRSIADTADPPQPKQTLRGGLVTGSVSLDGKPPCGTINGECPHLALCLADRGCKYPPGPRVPSLQRNASCPQCCVGGDPSLACICSIPCDLVGCGAGG